jgi:hypothetical protein
VAYAIVLAPDAAAALKRLIAEKEKELEALKAKPQKESPAAR